MSVRLTAKLTDSAGNPVSGRTVEFLKSADGVNFTSVGTAVTDSSGVAVVTDSPTYKTYYKARFAGDQYYEASESNVVEYTPGQQPAPQPQECRPPFSTGVSELDQVVICIGGIGISVAVLLAVILFLMLVLR